MPTSSPNPPSTHTVTVSSLGGLGDGITELSGKPLFIPKSTAGDVLQIRVTHENREALRGEIVSIVTPGASRALPPCPHFSECGGCSLQHLHENAYRDFKQQMAQAALAQAGFEGVPMEMILLPAASRRRVELKVQHDNGRAKLAYYAARTHDLVPIDMCLILEPSLQAILPALEKELGGMTEVKTINLTAADSGLDVQLGCTAPSSSQSLETLANSIQALRIFLKRRDGSLEKVIDRRPVTMNLGGYDIRFPPGAFLQASREGQRLLTDAVLKGLEGCTRAADLFSGIGTYSFPLSRSMQVHAVEVDIVMAQTLRHSAKQHKLSDKITAEARDLFTTPLTTGELAAYDGAVINPPRIGAKRQCEEIARSGLSRLVMVSCNPATFARDARALKEAGFSPVSALAVDQFVYSPHLEIVASFKR